ncbi:MAG: hypothetical protein ACI8P9_001404 [Parasphingorhabdus sp.]|jgi:hypothetical protein
MSRILLETAQEVRGTEQVNRRQHLVRDNSDDHLACQSRCCVGGGFHLYKLANEARSIDEQGLIIVISCAGKRYDKGSGGSICGELLSVRVLHKPDN